MTAHPLPWKIGCDPETIVDARNDIVLDVYPAVLAPKIVRAVNAHDAMVAALSDLLGIVDADEVDAYPNLYPEVIAARAALALAKVGA